MSEAELTARIKSLALAEGFARAGVAPAGPLPDEAVGRFREWISQGACGAMDYLSASLPLRQSPDRLVPGARSVLCLAAACPGGQPPAPGRGAIARYARGRDYHKALKARCHRLLDRIRAEICPVEGRAFVDSAPLMERSLAVLAGLGWTGRNGCLIVPGLGSAVLLAEIVSDLPLTPDAPCEGSCGACRACLAACPTGALCGDGLLDAEKCISYWNKRPGPIPANIRDRMGLWVCGCDACQDACPHNAAVAAAPDAGLGGGPADVELAEALGWTESQWDAATRGRGLRVVKYDAFLRNAVIASGHAGRHELAGPLRALAKRREDLADLVAWALDRLGDADGGG